MPWVKIDDHWPKDKRGKALAVGPLGRDLYVCGLAHCCAHLTDGFIPEHVLPSLAPGNPRPAVTAAKLVQVGLWEDVPGGWQVHDFLDVNESAKEVLARRDATRQRMSRWRKRGGDASRDAVTPALQPHAERERDALPLSCPILPPIPPRVTGVTAAASKMRDGFPLFDWTPEASAAYARGDHWLPGRLPFEAFNHDCQEPDWRGLCVRSDYAAQHPGAFPATGTGAPKQCPAHRENAAW